MTHQATKKQTVVAGAKVTLKTIADYLGLTPCTVSAALNNSAAARSIPERTKKRILAAAKDLNFETAAELRDKIKSLQQKELAMGVKVE